MISGKWGVYLKKMHQSQIHGTQYPPLKTETHFNTTFGNLSSDDYTILKHLLSQKTQTSKYVSLICITEVVTNVL